MKLTKEFLTALRKDVDVALAAVSAKHGIKMTLGRGTFSENEANFKMQVLTLNADQTQFDPHAEALMRNLNNLGLTPDHLKKEFQLGSDKFFLVGYNTRRPKNPMVLKRVSDGKQFIATEAVVAKALNVKTGSVMNVVPNSVGKLLPNPYPGFGKQGDESYSEYYKREEALYKEVQAKHDLIHFPVADGSAIYAVISLSPLQLQHVPYGDAWTIPDAHIRGLTTADVQHMLERDKRLAALFAAKR